MEDSEKRIRHYSSKHKILLVGEGDFSFSLCLASAFGSATNITATSLDSEGTYQNFIYEHIYIIIPLAGADLGSQLVGGTHTLLHYTHFLDWRHL